MGMSLCTGLLLPPESPRPPTALRALACTSATPQLTAFSESVTTQMERLRLILANDLDMGPHFEVPLLNTQVFSSLVSLQLKYFLQLNLMSARSVNTLAVAGWAEPLLPLESDIRNDVYVGQF
jgi:hypothetical protein